MSNSIGTFFDKRFCFDSLFLNGAKADAVARLGATAPEIDLDLYRIAGPLQLLKTAGVTNCSYDISHGLDLEPNIAVAGTTWSAALHITVAKPVAVRCDRQCAISG